MPFTRVLAPPATKKASAFDPSKATVSSRAATSTDYANADGTHTLVMSTTTVNFRDAAGVWQPVDNALVADPAQPGGFVSKANAWRAHFGSSAKGVTLETAKGAVSVVAVGATLSNPTLLPSGDGVRYADAWPNVDLTYTVTGDSVKESVIIKALPAASSFRFKVTSGDRTSVLKGAAAAATMTPKADGSVALGGAIGADVSLNAPMVLRADGEPVEEAHAALSSQAGQVVLSLDGAWLASQPADAFPVNLDPTLGVGTSSTWSYKSDGYSCSNCGIQLGNSRDSNTDRYWRSLASFPVGQVAGKIILDAQIGTAYVTGTQNGYPAYVYAPNNYSFAGAVGASGPIAAGTPMAGQNLTGSALVSWFQGAANAGAQSSVLGFAGYEAGGLYTYQKFNMAVYLQYDTAPSVAGPVAPSPGNGWTGHAAADFPITFAASASDPDGDPVQYYFRVAVGSDAESNVAFSSGWQSAPSVTWTMPKAFLNTRLYWHVYSYDGVAQTNPDYAWSFIVTNTAPNPAAVGSPGVTSAGTAGAAVVATTTPMLSVPAASDPDGDAVQYNFTISGGGDGPSGRASSGWQSANTWTVPSGVLADGQAYTWSVTTGDGPVGTPTTTTSPQWANTLTVNQRLGASSVTPSDSLAGVNVNLASGNATVSIAPHTIATVGGGLGVGLTYNSRAGTQVGLLGRYYPAYDRSFTWPRNDAPTLVRVDPTLDMDWNIPGYPASPPGLPVEQFMIQWTGFVTLPGGLPAGKYQIGVVSDDGSAVYLNNATSAIVSTNWMAYAPSTPPTYSADQTLTPGTSYPIKVQYFNQGGPARFSLYVKGTDTATAAAVAQQIVPSGWLSPSLSTLPAGWSLSMPGGSAGYTHLASGTATAANVVVLTDGQGAAHTWTAQASGGYRPPAGEDGTLTQNSDKSFTLADSDGSLYTFDAAGNPLTATSATDALHPAAAVYTYDTAASPKVIQARDPVSGKALKLIYGGSSCPAVSGYDPPSAIPANILCQVQYVDNVGAVLDTTDLLYSNGMLAAVVEPGNEVTQFGYTTGLLSAIKYPLAVDWQNADSTNRGTTAISALVSTQIAYRWVAPTAGSSNIRPANVPATMDTNGRYPAGSIPLVASVTAPSPDGTANAARATRSYTYVDGSTASVGGSAALSANRTQVTTAGISGTAGEATYDTAGRTLRAATATGQASSTVWDANDLPLTSTDPAGRVTTTIYDWALRPTDTYGPVPSSAPGTAGSCFQASRLPVASPPASCGAIPHTHTGYDTTPTGTRLTGLEATGYTTANLTTPTGTSAPVRATVSSLSSAAEASLGSTIKSSRYTGELALTAGSYTFSAQVGDKVNDGVRLYLDDQLVIDRWTTLRQAVLGDSPTGYWRLGDAPGTSAAAETGTAGTAANVTFGAAPNPASVDPTTTASFNGTNSSVSLPSGLISATNHPTIEMWFKTSSPGVLFGYQAAGNGAATSSYYTPALYVGADGALRGWLWGNYPSLSPITTAGSVTDNAWHHVVLTSPDGANQSMYLDGALIGTMAFQINTAGQPNNQVGAGYTTGWPSAPNGGGWSYFNGQIADVAVYQAGLTAQQVGVHYGAGKATLTHVTSMGPQTFTATGLSVAPGSLPAAPASVPHKIRLEYRNPVASSPNVTLWATPSGGTAAQVPASAYDPRYGLATYSATDDTGGVTPAAGQPAATVTGTSYSGSGLDPVYGLATDQIADPSGLALDTKTAYETPGATGYLRRTARALPSASITTAAQSTTTTWYGDTETRANPCVAGSPAVNQGGLAKTVTDPTPASGTAVTHEIVYDAEGHVVASRVVADGANWTCTTYDARARVTQVIVPAVNGAPARTITTIYAVGGNPLVSSVTDQAGTITTTVDLLGRTVAYTDVKGTTTTTTYDQAGRLTQQVSTVAAGGPTSTVASTYLNDGRVSSVAVDGTVVSQPNYDANAELSGVTYPTLVGGVATPAFVQQTSTHQLSKSSVTLTPTTALTAGNRLIVQVGVWGNSSATAASVTSSTGEVFTKVLDQVSSENTQLSVWTAVVAGGAGTTPTITVTPSATADVGVVAAEYSGLSTDGTGVDTTASATGSTTTAGTVSSGTAGPSAGASELAVGLYADSGYGSTLTAGTGWTQRANISGVNDLDLLFQDQVLGSGASVASTTGTGASTPWDAGVVLFKPAGAPATTTTTATPAFVQQTSTHQLNKTSVTVTPSTALTAGNRLVVQVGVWANPAATATAVTDSAGDVFTKVTSFTASESTEMSVWTAPVTAGAGQTPTITVTPTGTADVGVVAAEYSGLQTTGTGVDVSAHATGTAGAAGAVSSGTTAATVGANELAVGFYSDSGFSDTLTAGTGYTQRANIAPTSDIELLLQDKLVPTAGTTVASTSGTGASTTWEEAVVVFKPAVTSSTAPPPTGGPTVSTLTRNGQGQQTGVSYALPGHNLSDTVTRSQAGRVMTDTAALDGTNASAWTYTYDGAARLTQAVLSQHGTTPAVTYGYGYSTTGGCGADPNAGMDGARSSSSIQVGTAATSVTTSCTDYASRLTSITNSGTVTYNGHGDATSIGGQSFTYDASDRVTAGIGVGGAQTITYTLDATGRIVSRMGTGTGAGVDTTSTVYSYTGGGDTPDLQLTAAGTIGERYVSLPGGSLYTKRYANPGGDIWGLPNVHGDILSTTNGTGNINGTIAIYDPYGNPLNPSTGLVDQSAEPTTRTGSLTDSWEGASQRGTERAGSARWALMGARLYVPDLGQFTANDPVAAGNSTPYAYPGDPVNVSDPSGALACTKSPSRAKRFHQRLCSHSPSFGKFWAAHSDTVIRVAGGVVFTACLFASAGTCALLGLGLVMANAANDYYVDHRTLSDTAWRAGYGLLFVGFGYGVGRGIELASDGTPWALTGVQKIATNAAPGLLGGVCAASGSC